MLTDTRRNKITSHTRHRTRHSTSILFKSTFKWNRTRYFFIIYTYIYMLLIYIYYIYIYIYLKNKSVTYVTCTILLRNMQTHSVTWGVTCRFLDVKVFFWEKSTWNLESHKLLSQVLVSVRPVTAYCYW